MQKNNHLTDYDEVLDNRYGKEGTPERQAFEEEARAFYASQLLRQARKEAKITQSELAERVGTTKSYISKIENGVVEPGVGLFVRLLNAMDLHLEITHSIG